jgi:hypothetical protein
MSDLTITLPASFADGVGNTMDPEHVSTPFTEIEDWHNGNIGSDGVGDDNWDGNESLRGRVFRDSALKQTWVVSEEVTSWAVVPETSTTAGPPHGVENSPMPGGTLRFYLRHDAGVVFVSYVIRVRNHSDHSDGYDMTIQVDGATSTDIVRLNSPNGPVSTTSQRGLQITTIDTSGMTEGWHYVSVVVAVNTVGTQIVSAETELVVVAAYR